MFILFICLAVRFLEQRNRDLPLSPRVKEVISCQASSPPPPPPPSPTGRAAPAPNPEDFSHHSSAHKLPPPPPTTTTQLPTRSARASCDAAARKACKSLDGRLRERLTCQPRPSEFTILSRKMTAPIVGIPEGQVGRRHRIQSCRFDASSVSQKAVSAAIGLDSGERTQ